MHPLDSLPPGDQLRDGLVPRTDIGGQTFNGLPPRQLSSFRLRPQGHGDVSVQGDLQPLLEPVKSVTRPKIVVVKDVTQEDVERLARGAPIARSPRKSTLE